MIEDAGDPRRSSRGRHHGMHRPGMSSPATVPEGLLGIRQVAVVLDDCNASEHRLRLACHLSVCLDASLLAIGLAPFPSGSPDWISTLEQRFHGAASASRLSDPVWRKLEYRGLDDLVGYAKLADLMVLGLPRNGQGPSEFSAEQVVLASGGPFLLVPSAGQFEHVGQDVIVAWDGSREAARALADALPLLRDASRVVIMTVGEETEHHRPDLPNADRAVAFLERHGIEAFGETVGAAGRSFADAIISRIANSTVDLLVAGLFHHSPIREHLTGGTSRDLLGMVSVPMLVSH